jgi:hypothetical protein
MFTGDYTFLTTRPTIRRMSRSHPEILKVLPHTTVSGQTLKARITYTDATPTADYTIQTFDARAGEVYTFFIGYEAVAYPSKSVAKTLELYMGNYATATEKITYILHDYSAEVVKALYYINSYGGFDTLICEAPDQQLLQDMKSEQAILNPDFRTNYRNQRQYRSIQPSSRAGYSHTTGPLPSRKHLQALRDLFLIGHAWLYETIGGLSRYVPIDIDQDVSWPSEDANIQQLMLTYFYAIDVKSHSRSA